MTNQGNDRETGQDEGMTSSAPRPRRAFTEPDSAAEPARPSRGLVEPEEAFFPEASSAQHSGSTRPARGQRDEARDMWGEQLSGGAGPGRRSAPVEDEQATPSEQQPGRATRGSSDDHSGYRRPAAPVVGGAASAAARGRADGWGDEDDELGIDPRAHEVTEDDGLEVVRAFGSTSTGRRRGHRRALLATPLVLALLGGGAWFAIRGGSTPRGAVVPTVNASQTPSQPAASPSASSSPAPQGVVEAPGVGTVAAVRAHLLEQGFTCEKETQPGMDSWLCTHYGDSPAMMAYVGGATGHRLGRVALNVQDGEGGKNAKALALQSWLAKQFTADATQQKRVIAALQAGNEQKYAEVSDADVNARGSADGSIVLFVDGWVPDRAQPARLLPTKPLPAALAARGYTCSTGAEAKCTRTEKGLNYAVDYRMKDMEVSYLKVRTESAKKAPVTAAAAMEVKAITSLFQQGPAMQKWLTERGRSSLGATGFQEGMSLDWFPGSEEAAAVFYLRESCWTDTVEPC